MKLRVGINRRRSRVEIPGEDPDLRQLREHIKQTVLSSHGLSADTEFGLSLVGSELLPDTGQTLSSCGIVSGDLIYVILPESAANAAAPPRSSNPPSGSNHMTATQTRLTASGQMSQDGATSLCPPSSSSSAAVTQSESDPALDSDPPVPKWEPMLCSEAEEGQAPLSLEQLYSSAQVTSPSDAIMGPEPRLSEMPAGWRSAGGVYRLQYSHPLCENSWAAVVGVCMEAALVINATLKVNHKVDTIRKLSLRPSSYVTHEWPGDGAAAAFTDLRKLSRVFKDQLVYPLIAAAREAMALPAALGLAALPPELLLRILRLLDARSVVRLSSTCSHFHVATADSTLWRHLYCRDFSSEAEDVSRSLDTDWKEHYKSSHKSRRELQRLLTSYHPPPWDGFTTRPLPFFPPVPGIIGGDYDQSPLLPHSPLPLPRYDPRRGFI